MDSQPAKFQLNQTQRQNETEQVQQASAGTEFATPEEALRFDAAQTHPPQRLLERLRQSLNQEISFKPSWWKRWFGRGKGSK